MIRINETENFVKIRLLPESVEFEKKNRKTVGINYSVFII